MMNVKNDKPDISIMILCFNEEIHIERCIKNALLISNDIYLVDSNSTDKTIEIAKKFNVNVYQYNWEEKSLLADKLNWALTNIQFKTKWIMRLDSDEYAVGNFKSVIQDVLNSIPENINGIYIERRLYFMNKWMKHSGTSYKEIRLFRDGKAFYNTRLLDEEICMSKDETIFANCSLADDPITNLNNFTIRHNNYSLNEAIVIIDKEIGLFSTDKTLDFSIYYKLPHYWRALALFVFRYIIKGGFLDGYKGFLWCFFQTLWYRLLCDAKVDEIYSKAGKNSQNLIKYISDNYNIDIK